MDNSLMTRLTHAWNVFRNKDEYVLPPGTGVSYSGYSPSRFLGSPGSERSIVTAVYNRLSMDIASYNIQHVRVDGAGRFIGEIDSSLNTCLTREANKDQTGRAFIQDVAMSLFDEGVVAIVPIEADISPLGSSTRYEIYGLRTGKIVDWYPDQVRVELYNDITGLRDRIVLPKSIVGIVENPLYAVMNEPNSTMKRLINKLILLDAVDSQNSSGKLDLIIQLPYVIKSDSRKAQAEDRRKSIEEQLVGSKYGIAYTDGTERITQLNRPVENTLLTQITYLTNMLYSQLGISEDVFSGKADDKTMLNYYNRTIEPVVTAIIDELNRKFLTKTAWTQGQRIMGFRDIFRLIPANEIAEMADTFSRNEILSANEIRGIIGFKPNSDPKAEELRNANMPSPEGTSGGEMSPSGDTSEYDRLLEEALAGLEGDMMSILGETEDAAN